MKKTIAFVAVASALVAAGAFVGCSSDSGNGGSPDSGTPDSTTGTDSGADTGTGVDSGSKADTGTAADTGADTGSVVGDAGDGGIPAPPVLGAEIDRFGRPAVNTALDHTFDTDGGAKGVAKDAYNANKVIGTWTGYVPEFAKNLAIYDGLDTVCGNQAAYSSDAGGYSTLATVLSSDAVWLNTASTTCTQYLAVELNFLGVTNNDCGGRTLTENVIDVTYNTVAGTLQPFDGGQGSGPVTNGIDAPSSPATATFPYLAVPHVVDAGVVDSGTPDAAADAADAGDAARDASGQ